jgi:diguanylate cyclase (GGDEF)-like protein/PAS domain S-box-containing protein
MSPQESVDLLDAVAVAVVVADHAGRIVRVNPYASRLFGGRPRDLREAGLQHLGATARARRLDASSFDARVEVENLDGDRLLLTVTERDPEPDIHVLASVGMGTWDWHIPSGRVVYDSHWQQMLGYADDELPAHLSAWEHLVHPQDRDRVEAALQAHLCGRVDVYACEHRCRHRDGHYVWVLDTGRIIERDSSGRPLRAAGIHMDITERKRQEHQREALLAELERAYAALRELARQDDLTGVGNRRALAEATDRAWLGCVSRGEPMALAIVDLDGFKEHNDSVGHAAADRSLQRAALAMSGAVRSRDTITRFGGDEFVVVLPGAGTHAARQAGERLRAAVAGSTAVTASVGVAVWVPGCPIRDPRELFDAADAALFGAKSAGRDLVRVHPGCA